MTKINAPLLHLGSVKCSLFFWCCSLLSLGVSVQLQLHHRSIGRSENLGGYTVMWWAYCAPLVEIILTDLPKSEGGIPGSDSPAPSLTARRSPFGCKLTRCLAATIAASAAALQSIQQSKKYAAAPPHAAASTTACYRRRGLESAARRTPLAARRRLCTG